MESDMDKVYWIIPLLYRVKLYNKGKPWPDVLNDLNYDVKKLEAEAAEGWVLHAELNDKNIHIYREDGVEVEYIENPDLSFRVLEEDDVDVWSFTVEGGERVHVPGTLLDAKKAAVDAVRIFCHDCGADVTFKGYCFTYSSSGGVAKLTRIQCVDCDMGERFERYKKTEVIDTKLLVAATLDSMRDDYKEVRFLRYLPWSCAIHASSEAINAHVKAFEREVWFGGLQEWVQASEMRGASAQVGDIKINALASAGRWRATINGPNEDYYIDVLCAEDATKSTMGLNTIRATEEQAISLLKTITRAWKDGTFRLAEDTKVGFGF